MKYAEYCQQIQFLPFSIDELEKRLRSRPVSRWAFLLHDSDEYDDGSPKPVHVHVMMDLNSDQTPENIAKWFDDRPSQIERAKANKYAFETMCSYLIHETPSSDGKYRYDAEKVTANFDFPEFMEEIRHGVKEAKEKRKKHPIQDVLERICNNEIPWAKLSDNLSDMDRIKYRRDIDAAYNIRNERLARETDRTMNVMYFYGVSGTGKTTWAKELARKKGYDVFVSGSSNDPLQGYIGQECVILDDVRGSDWKINDLLKLLDNHTNSMVKSRYSNKYMNDCKLMILTSVESVDDLYRGLKESASEPVEQLKRRCSDVLKFEDRWITAYTYNERTRDYDFVERVPNPTKFMQFAQENKTLINDTLGYLRESLEENAQGEEYQIELEELEQLKDDIMNFGIVSNDKDMPF